MTADMTPHDDIEPTTLNNGGGAAAPLPLLPVEQLDLSQWTLIRDDRTMSDARSKANFDLRATKALAAKKAAKEALSKKKSMRDIFSDMV